MNLKGRTLQQARDDATIQVDNVKVCVMAIWAPDHEREKGVWLAALLNQHTPDYYQFYTVPSLGQHSFVNVVMYDRRAQEGLQVVGFAYPAKDQPLLKPYLIEGTIHDEPKSRPDG